MASTKEILTRRLRAAEVCERLGIGRTTLHGLIAKGLFPQPLRLTPSIVTWTEADVAAWLRDKERHPVPKGARGGDIRSPQARAAKGYAPLQHGRRMDPAPAAAPATSAKTRRSVSTGTRA